MQLIRSRFSFLLTLISLVLNTEVYGKTHGPLGLEKERCNLGRSIPHRIKSTKAKQWEVVNLTLKNGEISDYDKHMIITTKAWERVGGAGTLLPDVEGAALQKWQRRLKVAGELGIRIFIPFMVVAPAGAGVSHALKKYMAPLAVEYVAAKAAKRLSKESWADYLPYQKVLTKELVKVGVEKVTEEFGEVAEEYARVTEHHVIIELFHGKG